MLCTSEVLFKLSHARMKFWQKSLRQVRGNSRADTKSELGGGMRGGGGGGEWGLVCFWVMVLRFLL